MYHNRLIFLLFLLPIAFKANAIDCRYAFQRTSVLRTEIFPEEPTPFHAIIFQTEGPTQNRYIFPRDLDVFGQRFPSFDRGLIDDGMTALITDQGITLITEVEWAQWDKQKTAQTDPTRAKGLLTAAMNEGVNLESLTPEVMKWFHTDTEMAKNIDEDPERIFDIAMNYSFFSRTWAPVYGGREYKPLPEVVGEELLMWISDYPRLRAMTGLFHQPQQLTKEGRYSIDEGRYNFPDRALKTFEVETNIASRVDGVERVNDTSKLRITLTLESFLNQIDDRLSIESAIVAKAFDMSGNPVDIFSLPPQARDLFFPILTEKVESVYLAMMDRVSKTLSSSELTLALQQERLESLQKGIKSDFDNDGIRIYIDRDVDRPGPQTEDLAAILMIALGM